MSQAFKSVSADFDALVFNKFYFSSTWYHVKKSLWVQKYHRSADKQVIVREQSQANWSKPCWIVSREKQERRQRSPCSIRNPVAQIQSPALTALNRCPAGEQIMVNAMRVVHFEGLLTSANLHPNPTQPRLFWCSALSEAKGEASVSGTGSKTSSQYVGCRRIKRRATCKDAPR